MCEHVPSVPPPPVGRPADVRPVVILARAAVIPGYIWTGHAQQPDTDRSHGYPNSTLSFVL